MRFTFLWHNYSQLISFRVWQFFENSKESSMIYCWPSLDDVARRLVWRSCGWRHRGITKCCHRVALALRVRRECFMSHMTAFMWAIQFLTLELTERIALFSRQPQFSCNSLVVVVGVSADRSELKSKFCINSQRRRHSQDLRAVMSARQHSKRTVIVHDWADNRLTLWRHWRDALTSLTRRLMTSHASFVLARKL